MIKSFTGGSVYNLQLRYIGLQYKYTEQKDTIKFTNLKQRMVKRMYYFLSDHSHPQWMILDSLRVSWMNPRDR